MSSEVANGRSAGPAPISWRVIGGGAIPEKPAEAMQAQLEAKFQEGRQRGLAEGLTAARKEAEAQMQPALERLAQAIRELAECRKRVREEATSELVQLSVAIAARILHREITIDPDAVQGLIKAAFDKVQARENVRVYVHPSHEPTLRRYLDVAGTASKVEIVSDVTLNRGDIRLETSQGQLDASIDTQLREVERGLADRIGV